MTPIDRRRVSFGEGPDDGFEAIEIGAGDGPTVSVIGGVHGDEFEGVVACLRTVEGLVTTDVRGRVRIVPVAHEAAHRASLRASPRDGLNLARTFPGDAAGSPTERLADALLREVIAGSDLLIDLHSAGTAYAMPLLAGWADDGCPTCLRGGELAGAFGAPVLWRHPGPVPPGRTLSAAHAAGIPAIYAEAAGGGTVTEAHVAAYVEGLRRVLVAVGALEATEARPAPVPMRLAGEGNLDVPAMTAPFDGVCEMAVGVLDAVTVGQIVATISDVATGERAAIVSGAAGVVMLARRGARVSRGDNLVVLASPDDGTA